VVRQVSEISTILLVEDDADHALLIREALKTLGAEMIHVNTCAKALAELANRSFDLILLDMDLPDGSGLDIQEALLRMNTSARIVFVTSDEMVEQAVRAMKNGATDYVVKRPNYLKELRQAVVRSIEGIEGSPKAHFRSQERGELVEVLNSNQWNVSAAARHLNISRGKLRNRMKVLGLE
jgi:DNA-binding NtrC family response regulator